MVRQPAVVQFSQGLHARPASELVKLASRYTCRITIIKDDRAVDAKSILGVMSLGAEPGSTVTIEADGPDASDAVDALVQFLQKEGASS
ncbi:Phosphotransferase system, phosphocarrier protein HPr [Sulfobacillus acidophilus TPY]|uniref:Phosphocarrier protein HPr n=1 Tax=Sulfobacillus acidophilus (strain ATCC 700253 / DSM 10332 / NAL) TaxID=679936 RepID=G8U1M0_SULAD|nr:Phosphotransferase system, phosphocarrier protein HPr [Sulfobacillus acidophilus TPY]AEW06625.1 Phosphotransferase system, phosphocarrier protein HPr [Sulfobacillus acidophilus DSM 10332]